MRNHIVEKIIYAPWLGILYILVLVILGNWISDVVINMTTCTTRVFCFDISSFEKISVLLVTFLLSSLLFWRYRIRFDVVKTVYQQSSISPKKGLVLLLSPSNLVFEEGATFPRYFKEHDIVFGGKSFADDIKEVSKLKTCKPISFWNWEQIMRAVDAHCTKLQHICIIGSWDEINLTTGEQWLGSTRELEAVVRFLRLYLPSSITITTVKDVNFEDLESLEVSFLRSIDLLKDKGLKDTEIVIDVTGGQKIPSIAGAAVTLRNDDLVFEYVTNRGELKSYNIKIQEPISQ